MINILIVDDSLTAIAILKYIFESEPDFNVVGIARNGKEALEKVKELRPDIITMDVQMPIMDGFEAARQIMTLQPTPIVVITANLNNKEMHTSFRALEAGALSVLAKPSEITHKQFHLEKKHLVDIVRAMSEIKVFKKMLLPTRTPHVVISENIKSKHYEIVALGASVGGPQVLKKILACLLPQFPLPVVIVQHMTPGFIQGLAYWLNRSIQLPVKVAEHGEVLQKGVVYFAPDELHLELARTPQGLMAQLIKAPPFSGFCPSISVLFSSIARVSGKNAIGVLLTGMGNDGAHGLLELKKASAHTVIQDKESSGVFGMASVAQSLDACDQVLSAEIIGEYLVKAVL